MKDEKDRQAEWERGAMLRFFLVLHSYNARSLSP